MRYGAGGEIWGWDTSWGQSPLCGVVVPISSEAPFPVLYGVWFREALAKSRAIFCPAEVRIQQTAFLRPGSTRSGGSRPDACAFIPAIASTGLPAGKIQHLLCVGGLASSEGLALAFLPQRLSLAMLRSSHSSSSTP